MINKLTYLSLLVIIVSCNGKKSGYDATGSFEAVETIVSSEANGSITSFVPEEGVELKAGEIIGYIDSTQLYLKKRQLEAQLEVALSKRPDLNKQLAALREQLKTANREKDRVTALYKGDAATKKQLDDIESNVVVIQKQIEAQQSTLSKTLDGIENEVVSISMQIQQLDQQLNKCQLVNPINGTVLAVYANANEVTAFGKALYKIADVHEMILRAYISADQLGLIKLGDKVKIITDEGKDAVKEDVGIISFISNKAEFTPKTIQTKDERANMVYAMKIKVKNDGRYKIGMYGEVKFN